MPGMKTLRVDLWWNLCTQYLFACQEELVQAIQVSVVVSLVC